MKTIADLLSFLEILAPNSLQEGYDNAGLIVGNSSTEITGVLVSLDATEAVLDEAMQLGANVILSHHPIVFKGLKRFNEKNQVERVVAKAIKNDLALIAIHTNLDNVSHGVNKIMSEKLELKNTQILLPKENTLVQLGVYVPTSHAEIVREAISISGAGAIGEYDSCSFETLGTGRFRPLESATPFIGEKGNLSAVEEVKIECVVHRSKINQVISAMKTAHPYEEIAYHLFALENTDSQIGSGMIGELEKPMETMEFLNFVKTQFNAGALKYTSKTKEMVHKIALCGGSGSFLLPNAIQQKADVFITADFKYHEFFDAENNIIIADIGHFESEQYTSHYLVAQLSKKNSTFAVQITKVNTNPIKYI